MRNPNRLPALYVKLQVLHAKHPDLRYGQLVENLSRWTRRFQGKDLFYVEDSTLIDYLEEFDKYLG